MAKRIVAKSEVEYAELLFLETARLISFSPIKIYPATAPLETGTTEQFKSQPRSGGRGNANTFATLCRRFGDALVVTLLLLYQSFSCRGSHPEADENTDGEEDGSVRDRRNRRDCVLRRGAGRRHMGRRVQEEAGRAEPPAG